jgi:hypothetical protein
MAKHKIKAYSPNVLDYPSSMSMWEKESLAAEAQLAFERKSRTVTPKAKTHFEQVPLKIVEQILRENRKRRSPKRLHFA